MSHQKHYYSECAPTGDQPFTNSRATREWELRNCGGRENLPHPRHSARHDSIGDGQEQYYDCSPKWAAWEQNLRAPGACPPGAEWGPRGEKFAHDPDRGDLVEHYVLV